MYSHSASKYRTWSNFQPLIARSKLNPHFRILTVIEIELGHLLLFDQRTCFLNGQLLLFLDNFLHVRFDFLDLYSQLSTWQFLSNTLRFWTCLLKKLNLDWKFFKLIDFLNFVKASLVILSASSISLSVDSWSKMSL